MHIIKVEPLMEKQNTDVVHHIIVYACSKDMSEFIGKPSSCFAKEGEEEHAHVSGCKQQVIAGWAVGGQASSYPDNIGYPLYHDSGDMYVMMEMHYDNTNLQKGKIDNSGMRLWITEKLRQIDSGQAMMGIPVNWDEPVIPPGVKEYTIYGYCSAGCTDGFPKDGIKVFGGILHTHLAGRKVRMAHYRNGKELPPVMADEHYDFSYRVHDSAPPVTLRQKLSVKGQTLTVSNSGSKCQIGLKFCEYSWSVQESMCTKFHPIRSSGYCCTVCMFLRFSTTCKYRRRRRR